MSYRETNGDQELEDLRSEIARLKNTISGMVQCVGNTCPVCKVETWHYTSTPLDNRRSLNRLFVPAQPAFRRWGFLWKVPARPAHVRVNCTFCHSEWVEFPPKQLQGI